MNEVIIENYLSNIQYVEPEYMTEGIREFMGKFDKKMLKRTADKLHTAFTRGDGDTLEDLTKKTVRVAKLPKYQEVKQYTENFAEDNPDVSKSVELAKKVLKNTFKVKDKAKLEIISSAIGATSWLKSKGGKYDVLKMTKDTLKDVHTKTMHIYDTGIVNMETDTPEEAEMKRRLETQAKRQETIEMVLVGVVLSVLAAAIVWGGMIIWGIITSPAVVWTTVIIGFLLVAFKTILWAAGITAAVVVPLFALSKLKG
jgi:hypothetical protein